MTNYVQLESGLVLTETQFAEMTAGRPELKEIATIGHGRDITRGYVDAMPLLTPQDAVLLARGGGDHKIYEEIARDDQVKAVFEQRRLAVVAREYEVTPGDTDARAEEAAAFLSDQLERARWDRVTDKMLWGVFYGYAVGECLWNRDGNRIVLDAIKVRKQRRFAFDPDMSLRLKTLARPFGEELPARKFWTFSCGADNDDEPYGLGLAHWLYWPVFFKRNGIKFWLMFLEKFGQPTAKGTYPSSAQHSERQKLLQALNAISTDTGIIVPDGMEIELIEAARSGTADYQAMVDGMNAAISKVVLGHTGSSDATPGRLGGEDNAQDVRQDLIKADADLVCESFNQTVAVWLTEWNFGPDVAPPSVWRKVEEPEDLDKLAERDERLVRIGFRPTMERVTDVYGPDYEPVSDETPPTASGLAPEFAEGALSRDVVDRQSDQFDRVSEEGFDQIMEPVRRLIASAQDLEEIRDGLLVLYGDMDEAPFATVLQQALAAAHLAGRDDVIEGK